MDQLARPENNAQVIYGFHAHLLGTFVVGGVYKITI